MSEEHAELYKKYRPKSLKEVVGQKDVIRSLSELGKAGKLPHTILFSGPSGTGKTTLARILALKLIGGPQYLKINCHEINCANNRGIDLARDIEGMMWGAAIGGHARAYIMDECHALTSDAQSALLKVLEDTPKHVYFFLCTTDPQKLKSTITGRCHPAKLQPLTAAQLKELLDRVIAAEGMTVGEEAYDKIVDNAGGSARNALVLLNSIVGITDEDEQLNTIAKQDTQTAAVEICKALMDTRTTWPDMAKILKGCKDQDHEGIRRLVLAWANTTCLGGGKSAARAFVLLDVFKQDFYSCGGPGLTWACYEAVHSGGK